MKRVCAAFIVALVIVLPSFAWSQGGLIMPMPASASLCSGAHEESCVRYEIAAGADLHAFVDAHSNAAHSYRLKLELPAGEFQLQQTWLIDGVDIPHQISELSIAGGQPFTRLSGSRTLADLGAIITAQPQGRLLVELPEPYRSKLMSMRQYGGDDPAWPALRDRFGELQLARWPSKGWNSFSRTTPAGERSVPVDRSSPFASWGDEKSAWVLGFLRHGWHADYERLAGINALAPALRLGGEPKYGIGDSGRYRVLNLCSEMRTPAQYCIDALRGRLQVFPRDSSAPETLRLSWLEDPLLQVRGVRHIAITRLAFSDTRGHALVIENSASVRMSQLSFERIGRSGVVIDGGHDVQIRASSFADTGSHAAVLRGGDRLALTTSGHRIEDCQIRRPSQRLATPATAIRLEGVGHVVRGNIIEDAPHSAIYFDGNDHLIEENWIERVCLEVDDAGAIYAGRDWTYRGNIIRRNVIAAMPRRGGTANLNAVYLDDMLSGTQVLDNLVFDVPRGVLVGGGRDNVIEDNFFVDTQIPFHIDQRALEWASAAARPGGVMFDRLARVPYRGAAWRRAYPVLADILAQRPAQPLNNVARRNASLDSGAAIVAPAATADGQVEKPVTVDSRVPDRGSVREFLQGCALEPACAARIANMGLREGT